VCASKREHGSVQGAAGNRRPYRDNQENEVEVISRSVRLDAPSGTRSRLSEAARLQHPWCSPGYSVQPRRCLAEVLCAMCGSFSIDLLRKISLERYPQHALFRQEPTPVAALTGGNHHLIDRASEFRKNSSSLEWSAARAARRVASAPSSYGLLSHSTAMHDFLVQGA
jgi:hypothetical protein